MKKIIFVLAIVICLGVFASCASSGGNDTPVYGCDDRIIGTWVGAMNDENVHILFLSNGVCVTKQYDSGKWRFPDGESYYIDEGNILLIGLDNVMKYEFKGKDTLVLTEEGYSTTLKRSTKHFAHLNEE